MTEETGRYQPVFPVTELHKDLTRFGRPNDLSLLASPNEDDITSYLVGLIVMASILISFFSIWNVVLILFKCVGRRKAGFLAGYRFVDPRLRGAKSDKFRRPFRVRMLFHICSLILCAFVGVLYWRGLADVPVIRASVQSTNEEVKSLIRETTNVTESIHALRRSMVEVRDTVIRGLDDYCPNIKLGTVLNIDFASTDEQIGQLDAAIGANLGDFTLQMEVAEGTVQQATDTVEMTSDQGWVFWVYAIPLLSLSVFFMLGTLLASIGKSPKCLQFLQTYILLPIFFIWILLTWILGSASFLTDVVASDGCSGGKLEPGSPEGTVHDFVVRMNALDPQSLEYQVVEYFATCQLNDPSVFDISQYEKDLQRGINDTDNALGFASKGKMDMDQMNLLCGKNLTPVIEGFQLLRDDLQSLLGDVRQIASILSCDGFHSLKKHALHEGMCTHAVSALIWAFSSLMVISFCGMMMITLRASWLQMASPDSSSGDNSLGLQSASYDEEEHIFVEGHDADYTTPTFETSSLKRNSAAPQAGNTGGRDDVLDDWDR